MCLTMCLFSLRICSPPEIEPEDTTNVSTKEAAGDKAKESTGEAAPAEPKPVFTAPFIDKEPAKRPAHLPEPEN